MTDGLVEYLPKRTLITRTFNMSSNNDNDIQRAYKAGQRAYHTGAANPYLCGTDEYAAWVEGFNSVHS